MSSNYPAGVSDSHPYFNPGEVPINMTCEAEEALVVPSFAVKAALIDLKGYVENLVKLGHTPGAVILDNIAQRVEKLQLLIDEMETETDYDCQWQDELELPETRETDWDCPRCGVAQVADTSGDDR